MAGSGLDTSGVTPGQVAGAGLNGGPRPAHDLPPDIASALPTGDRRPPGPGPATRLKIAVRSWTTGAGIKRHLLMTVRAHACPPVRRALAQGRAKWVRRLPAELRERFELDGGVVDPLRVEIGSGAFPSPGYVHVDADKWAKHVEYVAPATALPFADGTVEELLAIHILEHVHASDLIPTLREWRRVVRPGGFAQIHVPDAASVFQAFLDNPPENKWTVMIPIFGMTSHAQFGQPVGQDLERHHVIYDFALLERVLLEAGFARVEDVSAEVTDRHTAKWRNDGLIPRMSLVVRAYAG